MALHRDLASLSPEARPAFEAFIAALEAAKLPYFIVETLREHAVQKAYYAQGRESLEVVNALRKDAGLWTLSARQNERIITKAKEGQSNHETGMAADIVPANEKGLPDWGSWKSEPERWGQFFEIAKSVGLSPGGLWKWPDPPHYELVKGA